MFSYFDNVSFFRTFHFSKKHSKTFEVREKEISETLKRLYADIYKVQTDIYLFLKHGEDELSVAIDTKTKIKRVLRVLKKVKEADIRVKRGFDIENDIKHLNKSAFRRVKRRFDIEKRCLPHK